jgi:hypothetical protein
MENKSVNYETNTMEHELKDVRTKFLRLLKRGYQRSLTRAMATATAFVSETKEAIARWEEQWNCTRLLVQRELG